MPMFLSNSGKSFAVFAALLAAGLAGNFFPLPLFLGVDFIFGSIAALLAATWFGPLLGTAAGALIGGYTWALWNHPYAALVLVAEAAFVGFLFRRKTANIILLDASFWTFLGMPLVGLCYGGILGLDALSVWLVMLKQAVNGVFNALIAHILHLALSRNGWNFHPKLGAPIAFYEGLFILGASLVFLPVLGLTVLASRQEFSRLETTVRGNLETNAHSLEGSLAAWFQEHVRVLQTLAEISKAPNLGASGALREQIALIATAFPGFSHLSLNDAQGTVLADHPAARTFPAPAPNLTNAAPFLSEAMPAPTPAQILTVPIVRQGAVLGFARGAIDLARLQAMLTSQTENREIEVWLLDQNRRIVAGNQVSPHQLMTPMPSPPHVPGASNDAVFLWPPPSKTLPAIALWQQSSYGKEIPPSDTLPWTISLKIPVASLQRILFQAYIHHLALALALIWLAFLAVGWASRRFTEPLSELARTTAKVPEQLLNQNSPHWPQSSIAEVNTLIANFARMVDSLRRNFQALQQRTKELEKEIADRHRAETALRETEGEIRALNLSLEERVADRTASLEEARDQLETFCYTVAHDLRAPLRAMHGFSQALLEDYAQALDATGRDYAQRILLGAQRLDALMVELLAYSRLSRQELRFETVPLAPLFKELLLDLEPQFAATKARVTLGDVNHAVLAHQPTLKLILGNLIASGLKFVPPNTSPVLSIWAEDRSSQIRIWVRDQGIGIPPEHQNRIFGIFERLHRPDEYPGTGMGLAIAQKGVERMGGSIGVVSKKGEGSSFWVQLPKAA